MNYVDIHSHLNFPDFNADREAVIVDMQKEGIATITVGTSLETSHQAVDLAGKHDNLFATIGVHPTDKAKEEFPVHDFEELVSHPKVVAIGECGLDYGKTGSMLDIDKDLQKQLFEAQIDLAAKYNKPLMIHCRNAYSDVLDILEARQASLRRFGQKKIRAHMHFFAGSLDELKRCLDNDFTVSFTGVITFAESYRELVVYAPLSHIMAETDAPFVSPVPYRGKRNDPRRVKEVVNAIAAIRGDDSQEVKKALYDNAVRIFNLQTANA